jgi:hypothetical protein
LEDSNHPCQLLDLCERLGTSIDLCAKAATPKYTRLDEAKRKYGGDATLVRLVTLEEDVDRLRACVTTIIKLLA